MGRIPAQHQSIFRLAHGTEWNDWHANVVAVEGQFKVLDYEIYVALDLDGDGDVDGEDVLAKNTYYKVRIVATPDAVHGGTYDVYINDVLVYEDASYRRQPAKNETIYARFARDGSCAASMAVDGIAVTSLP